MRNNREVSVVAKSYRPVEIEKKWQERWAQDRLNEAVDFGERPKWYSLVMFPYTSGDLHIGHWYNYAPADAHGRFMRMRGFNVMHPIGFDAFGLPAENAAIRSGIHPYTWTQRNIEKMERQLHSIGASFDWSRELASCVPEYYKWTEWFFLQFYKHGLAYRAKAPANWCPSCATVLANEQVLDGACERCHTTVVRREMEQWFFRITKYAEELLDMGRIQWPERIKIMQRNWIGKSVGAEIVFRAENGADLPVFTTRPDTAYGVSFMVMAPEHPLVHQLTSPERKADVEAYVEMTRRESEIERLSTEKEKTGVFIGSHAINPLNGARVPIWIADYVLLSYGTGTVMGVPAHDERDFEFARQRGIPIPVVIAPPDWEGGPLAAAYIGPGRMVNSGPFDGLVSTAKYQADEWTAELAEECGLPVNFEREGKQAVIDHLAERGIGGPRVSYRLRDWLISRQRYWGAPIPMLYCARCGIVPVPEDDLPVLLPEDAEFLPSGESPLARHSGFVEAPCPGCGGPARRETDTMDTFMCSSWYFLRYASPKSEDAPFDRAKVDYWLPVDQYMGGAEHAVMHLLYSRFFVKAIRDMGLVGFDEPFTRLFNQGMIISGGAKMSKSRGNVVAPDELVQRTGADAIRCYLMFIGPWDQGGDWSDRGLAGMFRYLNRLWTLVEGEVARRKEQAGIESVVVAPECAEADPLRRLTHKTIKRLTEDMERFRFNTTIAALMEFTNQLSAAADTAAAGTSAWIEAIDTLLVLLAPVAPHITEELWVQLGRPYSIHQQPWPKWREEMVVEQQVTLVLQVNGKVRDRVVVPLSIAAAEAKQIALTNERVQPFVQGKTVADVVYVPGRLVNIVAK